jgi:hypothetical protein
MSSEPQKETTPENQERSEREATFSRRGLLQWSVPAILAVSLPGHVSAGSGHDDMHHTDHVDTHMDDHMDGHQDMHEDSHDDSHGDHSDVARPLGKGSGAVPNFSQVSGAPAQGSGAVPNFSGGGGTGASATPGQGGSGAVPKFTPGRK